MAAVKVRCEVCHQHLGEREVEQVFGEQLELPCRKCWIANSNGLPPPEVLEIEWRILDSSRIATMDLPPGHPGNLIDVNMEFNTARDMWVFRTPRKLMPAAFDRAKRKVRDFYAAIIKDFQQVGLDTQNAAVVEDIERSLRAIEANRVENIVDPGMVEKPLSF